MIRGYDKSMKRHRAVCDCSDKPGTVVDGSRLAEFCMLAHFNETLPLLFFRALSEPQHGQSLSENRTERFLMALKRGNRSAGGK